MKWFCGRGRTRRSRRGERLLACLIRMLHGYDDIRVRSIIIMPGRVHRDATYEAISCGTDWQRPRAVSKRTLPKHKTGRVCSVSPQTASVIGVTEVLNTAVADGILQKHAHAATHPGRHDSRSSRGLGVHCTPECQRNYSFVAVQVNASMVGIVKSLDVALAGNNLEKMAETMDKFESQFETLDVQTVSRPLLHLPVPSHPRSIRFPKHSVEVITKFHSQHEVLGVQSSGVDGSPTPCHKQP